ncbi:hypothetical protein ACR20V_004252 [Salmonella enterica]|nr:hypothetical protein [Salmonella enterica subsp. enterica serovar Ituri]EEE9965872.1 hypothetical protein [Salmonella enterica subsp. enterica serovar Nigeria]EHC7797933.1 hypothetical protein [Salmonella enterica subsp. enterica serovar Isangi]EHD2000915.1 hypothetical protein [Salmonella enterica subsp. enterica serovar Isangi]EHD2010275.1 hypothetical protein [Salmonella enterica subsp. enterica serovar Isangi]
MGQQIAEVKILDGGETYLMNGSVFPVYMSEGTDLYLIEEYERGHPCEHMIKDLWDDMVIFEVGPIGAFEINGDAPKGAETE